MVRYDEEIQVLGYPLPQQGVGYIAVAGKVQGFRAYKDVTLIQHDAPTEGGHSGGPVINAQGEIIAVHTSWIGGEHSKYTIGVAINSARRIIPSGVIPAGESPVQAPPPVGLSRFSITDVSVTPSSPFAPGTEAIITAWVTNTSNVKDTKVVWLTINHSRVTDEPLTLIPGQRKQITFKYVFAGSGDHEVQVCSPDGCCQPITVIVRFPTCRLAVEKVTISPTPPVTVGTAVKIFATIKNYGEITGTGPVSLLINGSPVAEVDVTLSPGEKEQITFSPDLTSIGSYNIQVCVNGSCSKRAFSIVSKGFMRSIIGHVKPVNAVAFSPNGLTLASASGDATVKIWDVATGTLLHTLSFPNSRAWVSCVAFSPDGDRLAACAWNVAECAFWDTETWNLTYKRSRCVKMAFSPDGKFIAAVWLGGGISLSSADNFSWLRNFHQGINRNIICIAFSPNGSFFAAGTQQKTVEVWDVATGTNLFTLQGHTGWVDSVAFGPDGSFLASAGDHTVRLWDVASGRNVRTFVREDSGAGANAITFSPDGKLLACGYTDGTIVFWDVVTGQEVHTLWGHIRAIFCVAFSPDGKLFVSGSEDNTIKLWDVSQFMKK